MILLLTKVCKIISNIFPHTSIDITAYAETLPEDGSVPGMPEWKWIHTPGHTEGHIALFREKDRVLIAADAFSTTKQESLLSVIMYSEQISGPSTSTVIGAAILNSIVAATAQNLVKNGMKRPPIFYSANIDGGDELNEKLFEEYKDSIHYKFK